MFVFRSKEPGEREKSARAILSSCDLLATAIPGGALEQRLRRSSDLFPALPPSDEVELFSECPGHSPCIPAATRRDDHCPPSRRLPEYYPHEPAGCFLFHERTFFPTMQVNTGLWFPGSAPYRKITGRRCAPEVPSRRFLHACSGVSPATGWNAFPGRGQGSR